MPSVKEAFESSGLVKEMNLVRAPEKLLKVSFGSKEVNLGNAFTVDEIKEAPTSFSFDADPAGFYLLSFVDCDSPNRDNPSHRSFKMWMFVNVKGSDMKQGDNIVKYTKPFIQANSGIHRLVFVVYRQPYTLPKTINHGGSNRKNFNPAGFAEAKGMGTPEAGNFFTVQS